MCRIRIVFIKPNHSYLTTMLTGAVVNQRTFHFTNLVRHATQVCTVVACLCAQALLGVSEGSRGLVEIHVIRFVRKVTTHNMPVCMPGRSGGTVNLSKNSLRGSVARIACSQELLHQT